MEERIRELEFKVGVLEIESRGYACLFDTIKTFIETQKTGNTVFADSITVALNAIEDLDKEIKELTKRAEY